MPKFICLPADCCMADDSSTDESVCSMNCSDQEHSLDLHLDNNVSSTESDEYSFAKNKVTISTAMTRLIFRIARQPRPMPLIPLPLSGTQALPRKNALQERTRKCLNTITKGRR